jgi:transcriptional regulator with XRE-family HTH domain
VPVRTRFEVRLGYVLRSLRESRKLTQTKLADRVGTSQPDISFWESGRHQPTITKLAQVAELFGLQLSDLIRLVENIP